MAVTISISSITQNSQSVANNTSNVTVKLVANWTGGSWNHLGTAKGSLTINGTAYSFTVDKLNPNKTTTGSQTLMTKTVNVPHNADGTKTLSVSASFNTGIDSQGTKTTSASKTLTTIPRKSSISVSNGTLGTAQTITVTRQSTSFTHTIGYKCGSATAYTTIVSKSSNTSISWTPPLSLSEHNTAGTSVSITLSITTFNGSTTVGSSTTTISCAIPASVKPSCSISVSDPTGYMTKYGSYLKGLSKFKITVTPTLAYNSPITAYKTTANGATYTSSSFTTGALKTPGNLNVSSTITDKRGRSATSTLGVSVLNYIEPVISKLSVKRCDSNGVENDQGDCIQITMSAAVTALNNKNRAAYWLKYKKSTETTYTEVGLNDYDDVYSITDATYLFEADTGSSYDIELEVTDDFKTTKRATSASTAFTLMHWGDDGTSMGIGKVAEEPNLLDIGLPTRFNESVCGNVMGLNVLPRIPANSDFNEYMTIGCYAVYSNLDSETITNMPVQIAGRLEVNSATGRGILESGYSYIRQRFIPHSLNYPSYERDISRDDTNTWRYSEWIATSLSNAVSSHVYRGPAVLWSGARYMTSGHTNNLSEGISKQANGVILVFSRYANGAAENTNFNSFFVSKHTVAAHPGIGHQFCMNAVNFSYISSKYLYISDTTITGNDLNSSTGTNNGVTYNNAAYVLRYVIGV